MVEKIGKVEIDMHRCDQSHVHINITIDEDLANSWRNEMKPDPDAVPRNDLVFHMLCKIITSQQEAN